jgi:chromate transport protein ChrA
MFKSMFIVLSDAFVKGVEVSVILVLLVIVATAIYIISGLSEIDQHKIAFAAAASPLWLKLGLIMGLILLAGLITTYIIKDED